MEVYLAVVDDVGRHAGKGYAQVVGEVERVGIAGAELLEQFGQVLTPDDAASVRVALAEHQAGGVEVGVLLLTVTQALVGQVLLVGNHVAPVLHTHHRVERVGVVADGIQTADDASHRRAGDDVDGDACLFQYLQCTYMRHAFRTATAQHHGHLFSARVRAVVLLCA